MKKLLRRLKARIRSWWECRSKRCTYWTQYQVGGPIEIDHAAWHETERQAWVHFRECRDWDREPCQTCLMWERRLRA